MKRKLRRALTVVAAVGILASLGVAAPACAELHQIGTFVSPVYVTAPLHQDHDLYVVELTGRIRVMRDGSVLPQPFLDISSLLTTAGGEGGLLSVAFPPRYSQTGRFIVYYIDRDNAIQITEYRRSAANPLVADPASARPILTIPHPTYINHYGGSMQFGPDGMLYVGTGDGGSPRDSLGNAQNLGALLGKILRIDPFTGDPYAIPAGNPFVGVPGARPEVFDYGFRNPWRFSFDKANGDLIIGDVGENEREEIDYVRAPVTGGMNFGWNAYEGSAVFNSSVSAPGAVFPVFEYPHTNGRCSITGGYVVRDPVLTTLTGRYLYADWCTGEMHAITLGVPSATDDANVNLNVPLPNSFGEDAGGCLYAASFGGGVYRIAAPFTSAPVPCSDTPPDTTITSSSPDATSATFRFTSSEAGSTFECRIDGVSWLACTSPATFNLTPGVHSFEARATDPGGTVDPSAAGTSVNVG